MFFWQASNEFLMLKNIFISLYRALFNKYSVTLQANF